MLNIISLFDTQSQQGLIRLRILAYLILLFVLFLPDIGVAQDNILDTLEDKFETESAKWREPLLKIARGLFFGLVVIEWIISFGFIALNGGGLNDIASATIRSILFVGFGLVLLENPEWIQAVASGFIDSGSIAISGDKNSKAGVSSSNIFDMGLNTAKLIFAKMSKWSPVDALAYAITGVFIVVIFAVIAAITLVALIEMYIILSAGVVLLGFMATSFTKDIGLKYINYALSIGVKLFTIQLIAGLTIGVVQTYVTDVLNDGGLGIASALTLVAIGVVSLYLIQQIPNFAQSLISGVSLGSLPNVGTAARAASGAVGSAVRVAAAVKTGGASEAARVGWNAGGKNPGSTPAPPKGTPPSPKGGGSGGGAPSKGGSGSSGGDSRMGAIAKSAGSTGKSGNRAAKAFSSSGGSNSAGGMGEGANSVQPSKTSSTDASSKSTVASSSSGVGKIESGSSSNIESQASSSSKGNIVSIEGQAGPQPNATEKGSSDNASSQSVNSSKGVSNLANSNALATNTDSASASNDKAGAPSDIENGSSSSTPSGTSPSGGESSIMAQSDSTVSIPSTLAPSSTSNVSSLTASSSVDDSLSSKSPAQMKDQSSDDIARMKNQSQKDKVTSLKQKLNKRDSGSKV